MLRVDAPAAKGHAFHFQAHALFESRAVTQANFATRAGDALPGERRAVEAEETGDQAMVERVTGGGGDGGVGGGFALGDGADDAQDGVVALLIGRAGFADEGAFEAGSLERGGRRAFQR